VGIDDEWQTWRNGHTLMAAFKTNLTAKHLLFLDQYLIPGKKPCENMNASPGDWIAWIVDTTNTERPLDCFVVGTGEFNEGMKARAELWAHYQLRAAGVVTGFQPTNWSDVAS
jgi:hypothetical protein